jgi:signal transduction histidine kinase
VAERGAASGVLLAELNLKFVGDVVGRLTTGQVGYAYVVDEQGRLIAHHDVNLVLQNHDLAGLPQVRAARAAGSSGVEPALLGGSRGQAAVVGRDLQGLQVLSAHQRIDPPGWIVFVDQPLSEAYSPVYSAILRIAVLLVAGLAVAVIASLLLARRMVAPIRALQTSAARIGSGDLDQRIVLRTGDELEALGDTFNQMAARLRDSYASLESKVEERTHELGEAMVLLQEKSDQLAIADRAKTEFLSRMSHELRTPLNAIIGFAEIMELDPRTPSAQREWIQHILKAGRHLLALINEVLDIARIETGRMSLSLEPVALDATLSEVLDLVGPLAARDGIGIDSRKSAGAPEWVQADRQRLQQVLLNLLTNAIKYNRAGGKVTVSIDPSSGGHLRLTVRDTGPGIAADKLDRLFTPFDRLGAEESGIEGNGLGLAISRRLVEAMDGEVGVESVEGEGSAFWVELPYTNAPSVTAISDGAAPPGPPADPSSGPVATVLYVEDNLSNLELMKAILAFWPGITLVPAMQGSLGLILAQEHRPDLILLDLNLPNMHGDEVLERLRDDIRTRGVPVAVVSADATPTQRQRSLALGARAYLTKPLDVKQLLDLLEEVFLGAGATP